MPIQTLQTFTDAIHATSETSDLWDVMIRFMSGRGVRMASFHTVSGMRPVEPLIQAHGFPEDWVRHYVAADLIRFDPIVALAAKRTKPFLWSDVANLTRLGPDEAAFLRDLETAAVGDGLAMQVYGPNARSAYVGLGFGGPAPHLSGPEVFELKSAAQIGYLRYCELTDHRHALERDLSPREEEILGWIARGKSNGVIADILGVSRHTVDTNVRRIFEKLEVSDRTTAALRGIGVGIVAVD
ncbi:MAG: LuxR family transcriptional regulator [Pseudomonadota bacterium]